MIAVSRTCTPMRRWSNSGASLSEGHVASTKAAIENDAERVEDVGGDVASVTTIPQSTSSSTSSSTTIATSMQVDE